MEIRSFREEVDGGKGTLPAIDTVPLRCASLCLCGEAEVRWSLLEGHCSGGGDTALFEGTAWVHTHFQSVWRPAEPGEGLPLCGSAEALLWEAGLVPLGWRRRATRHLSMWSEDPCQGQATCFLTAHCKNKTEPRLWSLNVYPDFPSSWTQRQHVALKVAVLWKRMSL